MAKVEVAKHGLVVKGGTNFVKQGVLISHDSRYLLLAAGNAVKVQSLSSGSFTSILRHKADILHFAFNLDNQFQIFTCTEGSKIYKWNYVNGFLVKTYDLGFVPRCIYPLKGSCLLVRKESNSDQVRGSKLALKLSKATAKLALNGRHIIFFADERRLSNAVVKPIIIGFLNRYELSSYELTRKKAKFKSVALRNVCKKWNCNSVSLQTNCVASVLGSKLVVYNLEKKQRKKLPCPRNHGGIRREFTCVTCHPNDNCVATGVDDGRILVWWDPLGSSEPVITTYHWHALSVNCLSYTTEGSYMLSGGHECVLVRWSHGSQHKDTLPRLGSPLTSITCSKDGTLYALCHADNSIQVVRHTFKVLHIARGLTCAYALSRGSASLPAGLHVDPRSKALVLNGRPGHLQFYCLQDDKQLYTIDVVQQNYISPESLQRPLISTEVEAIALSSDGFWLATLQRRNDKVTTQDIRLKFWLYSDSAKTYELNTEVDEPHADEVTSLRFRDAGDDTTPMLVSASRDKSFKLWTLVEKKDIYHEYSQWSCESIGFYRDEPAGDADFSSDGSLLAVSFVATATVWLPETNQMKIVLDPPAGGDAIIRNLLFGRQTCSHYLLASTSNRIIVWNLLTCMVDHVMDAERPLLVRDPASSHFALFSATDLVVFKPDTSRAVFSHACLPHPAAADESNDDVTTTAVCSAVWVPHSTKGSQERYASDDVLKWQHQSMLYWFTTNQQLLCVDLLLQEDAASAATTESSAGVLAASEHAQKSLNSELIFNWQHARELKQRSSQSQQQQQPAAASLEGQPGQQFLNKLLTTPAHVLPPLTTLCGSFLHSLMLSDTNSNEGRAQSKKENASLNDSELEVEYDSDDITTTQT